MRYLGFILFAVLLLTIDWGEAGAALAVADIRLLALAAACNFLFIIAKSLRWYAILRIQNVHYGLRRTLVTYQAGSFCSVITPGKIGDFVKSVYLHQDLGTPYPRGLASVGADRAFDLATIGLVSLTLVTFFGRGISHIWSILAFLSMVIVGIGLLYYRPFLTALANLGERIPRVGPRIGSFRVVLRKIYEALEDLKTAAAVIPFLFSIAAYGFLFYGAFLLSNALGLPLDLFTVVYCITVANIVSLVPITISGIGTREAAMVVLFNSINLSNTDALIFSIGYFLMNLIFANTLGAIFWFSSPLKLKSLLQQIRTMGKEKE